MSARAPGRASGRGPGTDRLHTLAEALSERDRAVLASVARHRFLTTQQIERLHFYDHASETSGSRSARRVVHRLAASGLLEALPRRVGGFRAGSAGSIWHISLTGGRLLALTGDGARPVRVRQPSVRLVDHCLAIATAHVQLAETARAGQFRLTAVELEPHCWRRYPGSYGHPETLKPDLGLTTVSSDGQFEDRWLLEIDLGSEHPPTVLVKCRQYEAYRASGQEQQSRGVFPRVVWVVPTARRARVLQSAISGSRSLDAGLFRVVTTDELTGLVAAGAGEPA